MTYRLLFEMSTINDKKYASLLKPFEVVRGEPFSLEFKVKNLGKPFPGGNINQINLVLPIGITELNVIFHRNIEIPRLEPQEEYKFQVKNLDVPACGLAEISLRVEIEEKEKIEYFRSEKGEPIEEDRFFSFIYVVDRHLLEIISLLKDLVKGGENKIE